MIVFLTRYMDLFLYRISIYNTLFKILFITFTAVIIYLTRIKKPFSLGYDRKADSMNHYLIVYLPALIATLLFHLSSSKNHYYFEYFWSFSIWLEALAILPQLHIVYKQKRVEVITGTYMAFLGCYKLCYILNWIYILINNEKLIWMKFVA